ncbi:MAG: hypothetical protein NVSMB14_06730 [Isosphaeraceae bacterium]
MNLFSLAAYMLLSSGSPASVQIEAPCCRVESKAKTPAAQAKGYVCPITGQVLPCPNCCPANIKSKK